MKIRNGFVSNSSSSSFVISSDKVTAKQLYKIINHCDWGKMKGVGTYYDDPWHIEVDENEIRGETSMDNFNMREFLEYIEINKDDIEWDDSNNWDE